MEDLGVHAVVNISVTLMFKRERCIFKYVTSDIEKTNLMQSQLLPNLSSDDKKNHQHCHGIITYVHVSISI